MVGRFAAAILLLNTAIAWSGAPHRWEGSFRYVDSIPPLPETVEAHAAFEGSVGRDGIIGVLTLEGPLSGAWSVEGRESDGNCRFEGRERGTRLIVHGDCSAESFSGLFQYEGEMRGGGSFSLTGGSIANAGEAAFDPDEKSSAIMDAPPLGLYVCSSMRASTVPNANATMQRTLRGSFTLMEGGRYRWMDGGHGGDWAFDPATGMMSWSGGMLSELGASESSYDPDRGIRIILGDGKRWSCWTDAS